MSGLINPPQEAATCRRMLAAATERRDQLDKRLTKGIMDRETYLQVIGERLGLEALIKTQTDIYNAEFNI